MNRQEEIKSQPQASSDCSTKYNVMFEMQLKEWDKNKKDEQGQSKRGNN
jgi:hypothetical protein